MDKWQEIREELERIQKIYTNDQFLDFLATSLALKEADKKELCETLSRLLNLELKIRSGV